MQDLKIETKSTADVEKILSKLNEDKDLANIEEMVIDNKVMFEYKDKKYRVRLMNLKEKHEFYDLKVRKYAQLIQDKDVLLEKDLISVYRQRGMNIDELDDNIKKINSQIVDIQIKLGESLAKHEEPVILNSYREKITNFKTQRQVYDFQKTDLLRMSLENQLLNYEAEIITYLTLDTLNEDKWARLFNSYEDFISYEDETLLNMAGIRSMYLQYV